MKLELSRSLQRWLPGLLGVLMIVAAGSYYVRVPDHPPGFSIDESSICYNAWSISQTGHDEYGKPWPLFFRAFGEYKNPTIIYLLAALFRVTGPTTAAARLLTASFGVLAAALLGLLAWQMTRRFIVAAGLGFTALLTPWLFESSRLVFEVALYPALLVLFLLAVWRAHQKTRWGWRDAVAVGITLALLTYSYSIGRLLAPLLALGLAFFIARQGWRSLIKTWIVYGSLCLPLLIFHQQDPEALTGRFHALTYLSNEKSLGANLTDFARHYLANVNPWRWLVSGENNIRDHVEGTGCLLLGAVILAGLGAVHVWRHHRREPWWQFVLYGLVVSPIPASLTSNPFPQLRLIAFPIFFLVLTVPAIEWLIAPGSGRARSVILATAILLVTGQGLWFQKLYHKAAPRLWYVFDARFPRKVLAAAVSSSRRPIYLRDEPGKAGYIHALWYGVLARLDPATFVRLPSNTQPPPGSVVLSTEETCQECRLIARALNYIVYSVPPHPSPTNPRTEPLREFRTEIVSENPPAMLSPGQQRSLSFLIRNISAAEWPCVGDLDYHHAVVVQSRWLRQDGSPVGGTDTEQHLPYDIEPGDTVGITVPITAPPDPGRYYLDVDLVQKGVARFGGRGSVPSRSAVEVVP